MKYREILLSTNSGDNNAVSSIIVGPSGLSLLKSYTDYANSSTAHHIGRRINLNDPDSDFAFQTTVFSKLYNSFTGTHSPQSLTGTFIGFLGNSSIADGYYYHFTTGIIRKIPFDAFDSVSASLSISAPDGRDLKEDDTHLYYYDSTSLKKVLKSTLSQDGYYDVGASKTLNFCVGNEYVYSIDSTKTLKKFNKSTKALIGSYDDVLGMGTINSIAVNTYNENIIFVAMGNYVYEIYVTSTPYAESITNLGNYANKYALEPNKDMLIVGSSDWSGGIITQINMSTLVAVGSSVAVNGQPKHFTMGTELNPSLTYVPVASTITKTNYTLSGTQFTLNASGRNATVTGSLALDNINLSALGVPVGVTLTSIKLALKHRSSYYSVAISNTWNASLNGTNVLTQSYSGTTVMTGTTSSSYLPDNTTVDANTAVSIAISGSCVTGGTSSLARSTHILDDIKLIIEWEEAPVVNVDGTVTMTNGIQQITLILKSAKNSGSITLGTQQTYTYTAYKPVVRYGTVAVTNGISQNLAGRKLARAPPHTYSLGVQQTLTFKKGRNIQIPAQTLGIQQALTFKKGRNVSTPVQTLGIQQTALATKKSLISFTESLGVKQTALASKHTTTAISVSNGAVTTGTGRESSTGFLYSTNGNRIFLSAKKAVSSSAISTTVGINTSGTGIESHTVAVSLSSGDRMQMTVKKSVKNTPAVTFLLGNQQNITAKKNATKSVDTSSGLNTSLTSKKNQTTILEPESLGVKQTVTTLKNVPISVSDSLGEHIFVTKKKATQSSSISLTVGIQMNVHMGGKFFVLIGVNQFLSAVKKTVTTIPVALGATVSLALMKSTQNFLAESEGIQMTLTAKKAVKQSVSLNLNTQETVSGMKQSTVAVAETVGDSYTVEAVKYAESSLTLHHGILLFVSSVESAQTAIQMTQGTKQTLTAVKGVTADVLVETNTEESVLGRKNAKKSVTISSGARQTFTATKSTTRALTFSLTPTVAVSSHKAGSSDPVLNSATLFEVLTASAQKFSLEVEPNAGEHIAVTVEKASSDSLLLTLASEMTHEGEKGAESELTDSLGFLIDVTVTRPNLAKIKLSHGINLTVIGVRSKYISLADSLGVQVEISTEATSKLFRVKPEKRVGTLFRPQKFTCKIPASIKKTYKSTKVVRKY